MHSRVSRVMPLLVALGLSATATTARAQTWTIGNPTTGNEYTNTSDIGVDGTGPTDGGAITIRIKNESTLHIMQSVSTTVDPDTGNWLETLEAPNDQWPELGNAIIEVMKSGTRVAWVRVKIIDPSQ